MAINSEQSRKEAIKAVHDTAEGPYLPAELTAKRHHALPSMLNGGKSEQSLAIVTMILLFLVVTLLCCLTFCRKIRRRCCRSRSASAGTREFSSLNDWVCDMDRDVDQTGRILTTNTINTTNANRTNGTASDIEGEWEEVTVESVFPSILSKKKKSSTGLSEPLLSN